MIRKPLTAPRKQASQSRSRATVDALVEATARLLVRDGYDRATTNRIADVAGVGIGSLYQYFPNKEALVAAVIDRHHRGVMQRVRQVLNETARQPIAPAVRKLVAVAVEAHGVDPELRRALAEQAPHVGRSGAAQALHVEGCVLFRDHLANRRDELRIRNLDLAAFVCATSLETLTHEFVLHRPDALRDVGAFVDETARLICGYLLLPADAPSPSSDGPVRTV